MTILVDELEFSGPNGKKKYCHMVASTLEELHAFAQKIGRKRCWFHNTRNFPHYDLDEKFRQLALDHGAQETTARIYVLCKKSFQMIETAPKDGTLIYVVRPRDGRLFKCRWDPNGSSIINGRHINNTGHWEAEVGGWFEPHEVMHWAPITDP